MVYYIACGVLVLCVLFGIKLLSSVKTARAGNILSAVSIAVAIILTLYYNNLTDPGIYIFIVLGLVFGLITAKTIKMIDMPQGIALLNGFGGLASALVVLVMLNSGTSASGFEFYTAQVALSIGLITFGGSMIAAFKLHRVIPQKPVVFRGHNLITVILLLVSSVSIVKGGTIANLAAGLLFGIAFSIRVGGADMPITISLLNSLSGVAGGIAGIAISDPLLTSIGGIVGASGLILTQIMCRAMNRSLVDILLGKTSVNTGAAVSDAAEEKQEEEKAGLSAEDIIRNAKKVIIVPGYGMAISQAQSLVKILCDRLEEKGVEVKFAIHPVAGRMPGHMNVLLCEVDVPYDKLYEMDVINDEFAKTDLVIAVGANDVINPAANTAEGTPIYGMPVLKAEDAKYVIICNMDTSPGYSGVDNPLYKSSKTIMLTGDAKDSLKTLLDYLC